MQQMLKTMTSQAMPGGNPFGSSAAGNPFGAGAGGNPFGGGMPPMPPGFPFPPMPPQTAPRTPVTAAAAAAPVDTVASAPLQPPTNSGATAGTTEAPKSGKAMVIGVWLPVAVWSPDIALTMNPMLSKVFGSYRVHVH